MKNSIDHIIALANAKYDEDDTVSQAMEEGDECGDTLALFVVRELRDVFSPSAPYHENAKTASQAMFAAAQQLLDLSFMFRQEASHHG